MLNEKVCFPETLCFDLFLLIFFGSLWLLQVSTVVLLLLSFFLLGPQLLYTNWLTATHRNGEQRLAALQRLSWAYKVDFHLMLSFPEMLPKLIRQGVAKFSSIICDNKNNIAALNLKSGLYECLILFLPYENMASKHGQWSVRSHFKCKMSWLTAGLNVTSNEAPVLLY